MPIDADSKVELADDVHVREFDGELVVLDLKGGDYFGLNETGARLWQGLAAGKTPREVAREMEPEFEVEPAQLLDDLVALARQLEQRGLVVRRESS